MKKIAVIIFSLLFFLICSADEKTYSIYMMGNKIGSSIDKWSESTDKSGTCIITLDSSSNMEINRGSFVITMKSHSIVKADCKKFTPVSVESESSEISSNIKAKGVVKNGVFTAELEKNNNRENFSYSLEGGVTFFSLIFKKFSAEQLLKGGKTTVISEDSLSVKEITYSAVKETSGNIKATVNYGGIPITFVLSNSVVIRSELQNGLITYTLDGSDTSFENKIANSSSKNENDIIASTAIENKGIALKRPRFTKKVVFTFTGENGGRIPEIPEMCFQKVKKNGNSVSVTNTSFQYCDGSEPEKQDTMPNLYEDSNNKLIADTAKKIVNGAPDRNEMIKRMVRFVFRHIKDKNYKFGNLSASEVLKEQSGDCTEHSTLLSALLKSIGIPVKMAYGLVLDNEGRFFFHNWNIVYNGGKWINVDSTFGIEKADSSRILLMTGNGTSQSREDISLTVLKFMNNIEISVTGFEYE
ncbi:MAG TPA: transglutaminase-like domain-containing protein [bacterium]|nr:transglutaminase-like domain-containing protein [bacterium]HPS29396.1 transglutaminase-like domain-containing protein [bacterium]